MIGIPLMFMCLTYTGDLLADAFISGYSKMVNFIYRQICRGRLKNCVPDEARRSFEQPDVRKYLLNYLDVKLSNQFPFFRPFQRNLFPYKPQHVPTTPPSKLIKQHKTSIESTNLPLISTLSIPSTIATISNLDAKSERTASTSSILAVI